MNARALSFIDANVIMYAIGGVHPLKEPCVMLLQKIRNSTVRVVSNTEGLQEILYRYFSIKKIYSTDPHFDLIPGIRRIQPG